MIDLEGKVILVTGSSRGIGAATALTCARAGASSSSTTPAPATARRVASEISPTAPSPSRPTSSSPTPPARCSRVPLEWRGRVDVLVNNAAVYVRAGVDDPVDQWREAGPAPIQVNLYAAADLCREAINHFIERGCHRPTGDHRQHLSRAAWRGEVAEEDALRGLEGRADLADEGRSRCVRGRGILAFGCAPGWCGRTWRRRRAGARPEWGEAGAADGGDGGRGTWRNTVAFLASGLAPHMTGATLDINGAPTSALSRGPEGDDSTRDGTGLPGNVTALAARA
jgi:NAD(P)-dependent dehydrogenase (short-subunit alcohol dehydrogenase family)